MKRKLTAWKIYNEWLGLYFLILRLFSSPWLHFPSRSGFCPSIRRSCCLTFSKQAAQTELLKSLLNETIKKPQPRIYCAVGLCRCFGNQKNKSNDVRIQTSWRGKWSLCLTLFDYFSGNDYTCVNKVWSFLHFLQQKPTIIFPPPANNHESCPLDSQRVWMHLILTSDLRTGLGRLWEHGEMLILGSSSLAAITSSQQVVGGQRKERGSRKQRGIR